METLMSVIGFVLGWAAITFFVIKGLEKIGKKKVVLVDIEEPESTGTGSGGGGGRGPGGPNVHQR